MGTYVDELYELVPEGIAPAVNHLIERFVREFYWSAAVPPCASALHDRGLNKKQTQQLFKLLEPVAMSHFKFVRIVHFGPKPEALNAFRDVWIERTQIALRLLFTELLEVGYVNHADLPKTPPSWAREVAMKILDGRKPFFSYWIRAVCDDNFHPVTEKGWQAPKLVLMKPLGRLPYITAEVWERVDPEVTLSALATLSENSHLRIVRPLRQTFGEAEVDWAKRPKKPPTPRQTNSPEKPSPSKSPKVKRNVTLSPAQRKRTAVIFGAIQCGFSGRKYCAALDERQLRIPGEWIAAGCPATYSEAYLQEKWRQRIQNEKSKYGSKYSAAAPAQRESLIQQFG